ncbi:MAG: hypothetical protein PUI84_04870, partial [Bacteroidales bacterium]|nr:hypothetical protein [Bacteroidales bacterium]
MKLTDITKGSEYDLSLFSEEKIAKLESQIVLREGKKGSNPSLSATNAENQQIAKQTPSFAPKNVKSGV